MATSANRQLEDFGALKKALGRLIVRYRTETGLQQRPFSRMSGVGNTYLRRIEQGEASPSIVVLTKIAETLDLSPGDLLDEAYDDALRSQRAQKRDAR